MKKVAAVMVCLCITGSSLAEVSVGSFYDIERRLVILEHNWFSKLNDQWSVYGFNEAYRNPQEGFPPGKNVLFGKSWLMRDVGSGLSIGIELEHGYNNAGMYSRSRAFAPDTFRVLPKLGISVRLQ